MEEKQAITEQDPEQGQDTLIPDLPLRQESLEGIGNEPASNGNSSDGIARIFPILLTEMQTLRQDFDTKVKYDESKERLIDSLHSELQAYREGLHFKILRPVLIDLIAMYDDLAKSIDIISARTSDSGRQEMQTLRSFQETVEEILSRNGVMTFEVEEDIFLGSKQRIQKMIATLDGEMDKHIARRVRKGFAYENRILRLEIVEVYKYVPVDA